VKEQSIVHLCYGVDVFVYGVGKMVHSIVIGNLRETKIASTGLKMISVVEQSFKTQPLCEFHFSV
jgi:hypothetical protein